MMGLNRSEGAIVSDGRRAADPGKLAVARAARAMRRQHAAFCRAMPWSMQQTPREVVDWLRTHPLSHFMEDEGVSP